LFLSLSSFLLTNNVAAATGINSLAEPEGDVGVRAWLHMLQFQFSCGRQLTLREVELKAQPLLDALALNDGLSGNRHRLFRALVALCHAYRLGTPDTPRFDRALGNLALVARLVARHLVEVGSVSATRALCAAPSSAPPPLHHLGPALIAGVVAFVVDVPVTPRNYWVHFELVTLLSVLLSGELFAHDCTPLNDAFYVAAAPQDAVRLVTVLLHNFAAPRAVPASTVLEGGSNGFLYSFAASAFDTIVSFTGARDSTTSNGDASPSRGGGNNATNAIGDSSSATTGVSLANASLLQLLVAIRKSPFRKAFAMMDSVDIWRAVFERLATSSLDEPQQLLLYALFRNASFLEHVLSRVDVERLVEPMLRVLYVAVDVSAATHHQYVMLNCLLALSTTASFNRSLHLVSLDEVPWYKTAVLSRVTLESLLVLLVLQTVHRNLAQYRDEELHLMCRAILSNVSVTLEDLHAVPADKLVRLFQTVQRKARQLDDTRSAAEQLGALEDVLDLLLSFMVRAVFESQSHSPCIVYALLNAADSVRALTEHASLGANARDLLRVIEYFSRAINIGDARNGRRPNLAALVRDEVKRAFVSTHSPLYRAPSQQPRTMWTYTERHARLFSLLVWRATFHHSIVAWEQRHVKMFSPDEDPILEAN
jgi:hypothetical protein